MIWLGVDTGGTFTDFVCLDEDRGIRVHKVLSTPEAPERAILEGIRALGLPLDRLRVVHGSTVATNAALEGKGVRTVFVTNRGFADLLTIGRQARRELYELRPRKRPPPVPPELCLETGGRVAADGSVIEPLTEQDISVLRDALEVLGPEAVAVNLVFSYLAPELEQRLRAAIPDGVFCSLSSEVLPEVREYERGMATWLNAWVGPRVAGYLRRLGAGLPGVPVSVMQSSGETMGAEQATGQAVRMLLSGPAGGLVATQYLGELAGFGRLLTFDMGGTSTDVALIEGDLHLTTEGHIGDWPVAVPMMDMHTIGAGGGSIVWLDAGGMLQVGPESAGAAPGPACYGRGGQRPTVTDANLLLGRLRSDAFLGGEMGLDRSGAERAMRPVAEALGGSLRDAARAVVDVANAHMARALRTISIRRGVDTREHLLVSFGGAGGLHVCELAEALQMRSAMVPVQGGVLSALGMLAARPGRQLSRTLMRLLDESGLDERVVAELARLRDRAAQALGAEGISLEACEQQASADLRYQGQSYTLNLPWEGAVSTAAAFHDRHAERYGHSLDQPVELVTLRLAVRGSGSGFRLAERPGDIPAPEPALCRMPGGEAVSLYQRDALPAGFELAGPAIIAERVATTWVARGWRCQVDRYGNLLLASGRDAEQAPHQVTGQSDESGGGPARVHHLAPPSTR